MAKAGTAPCQHWPRRPDVRSSSRSTTSPRGTRTLSIWESADTGLYRKVRVRVATLEGELTAWVYVLNDFEGGTPSARTIGILADAAEAAGAPTDYVAELRRALQSAAGEFDLIVLGVTAHQAAQRSSTNMRIMPNDGLPSDPYARAKIAATAILDRFEIAQLDLAFVLGSGWAAAADDLGESIGSCELADLPGFANPQSGSSPQSQRFPPNPG